MNRAALALALALTAAPTRAQDPALATKADLLWQKLEARTGEISGRLDGVIGIAILDLTDGRLMLRNADQVFPTASSIKLPMLVELYRQDQEAGRGVTGMAKLTDLYTFDPKDLVDGSSVMRGLTPGITRITNRDLAQFMLAVSDNAATNVLYDRLGKDRVNATLERLGLRKTLLRRKMMDGVAARRGDENVATPHELVLLLQAIHQGKTLDAAHTSALLDQLSTPKESYLPRLLPEDLRVANKPGSLDGVRTDSGIVYARNRPFAISVMTTYDRVGPDAEAAISQVALAAYRHFEMLGSTSEYGRVLP